MSLEKMEVLIRNNQLKFPMPDVVIIRLNALINDDNSSMEEIADMVETNPVLAGKILQVANSAALRTRSRTVTIGDAIKRLGLMFVRDISLALTLSSAFKGDDARLASCWQLSLKVASRMLILSSYFKASSNTAMLAGLLSRIGELPILAYIAEHGEIEYTEKDVQKLSARIIKEWKLPDEIQAAARRENKYGDMLTFVEGYVRNETPPHRLRISYEDFQQMESKNMESIKQFEDIFQES